MNNRGAPPGIVPTPLGDREELFPQVNDLGFWDWSTFRQVAMTSPDTQRLLHEWFLHQVATHHSVVSQGKHPGGWIAFTYKPILNLTQRANETILSTFGNC